MKQKNIALMCILVFLTSFCLVSALGVGSPYTSDDPMQIYPGETKTVSLSLQNSDVEEGLTLTGSLSAPLGITASLDKETYNVGYKEAGVYAIMTVKMSSDAKVGDKYTISASFTQQNVKGGGMIALGAQVTRIIGVVVIPVPPEPVPETPAPSVPWGWIIGIIVVIIIIVLVIYLILRKRNK